MMTRDDRWMSGLQFLVIIAHLLETHNLSSFFLKQVSYDDGYEGC